MVYQVLSVESLINLWNLTLWFCNRTQANRYAKPALHHRARGRPAVYRQKCIEAALDLRKAISLSATRYAGVSVGECVRCYRYCMQEMVRKKSHQGNWR